MRKTVQPQDKIFCLVERNMKIRDMDAFFLEGYLHNGYAHYSFAEDAEAGRQNGDAYDNPGATRVVGFRVKAFLPKKRRGVKTRQKGKR